MNARNKPIFAQVKTCLRKGVQQQIDRELERVRQRLTRQAVLLRSGLNQTRISGLLEAEDLGAPVWAAAITDTAAAGGPGSGSVAGVREIWAAVTVMEQVASYAGAPLAWGCESLAAALSELLLLRKRRRVLLSGPKSSMVIIACLPIFALGLGHLIGFSPLSVLLTPAGSLLLCGGVFMLLAGIYWVRVLVRSAEQAEHLPGFECELLVLALRGGLAVARAKRLVVDEICKARCGWLNTDELANSGSAGGAILKLTTGGAGSVQVLLETAAIARRKAAEDLETAAEKLGSKVLLPMGICVLPAFVLLGVLPTVISMFHTV